MGTHYLIFLISLMVSSGPTHRGKVEYFESSHGETGTGLVSRPTTFKRRLALLNSLYILYHIVLFLAVFTTVVIYSITFLAANIRTNDLGTLPPTSYTHLPKLP